jgi:hypothetical protein
MFVVLFWVAWEGNQTHFLSVLFSGKKEACEANGLTQVRGSVIKPKQPTAAAGNPATHARRGDAVLLPVRSGEKKGWGKWVSIFNCKRNVFDWLPRVKRTAWGLVTFSRRALTILTAPDYTQMKSENWINKKKFENCQRKMMSRVPICGCKKNYIY